MKNFINTNKSFKSLIVAGVLSTSLYGASNEILLENAWINIGYSNAKDVMLGGATTATGKGYSALYTNPAGLSTNYALGAYFHSSQMKHQNATGSQNEENALATTQELAIADNTAVGLYYKSVVLEMRPNRSKALGAAYGLETEYGLFSLGLNYVQDDTTVDNYLDYGTGDYQSVGFQWQKSFIGVDDFYALYFGYSQKGQGVNVVAGEQVARVSPKVQRIGFGVETDVLQSTLLFSFDTVEQSWSHLSDKLNTQALGLKWMIWSGFSTGLGVSNSTYTTDVDLKDSQTLSLGFEFGFWQMNIGLAYLQKEVKNNAGEVYIKDENIHADISFAF